MSNPNAISQETTPQEPAEHPLGSMPNYNEHMAMKTEYPTSESSIDGIDEELYEATKKNIALDQKAIETAGLNMEDAPEWDEIQAMREANPNGHPRVFWQGDGILHVNVSGEDETLTPEEALEKYKDNDAFVKEYMFLMKL